MLSVGASASRLTALGGRTPRVDFCGGGCDAIWRVAETLTEQTAMDGGSASRWTSSECVAAGKSRTSSSAGRC